MDPFAIASLAAGQLPSTSDLFNTFSTMYTNKQNKDFALQMYNRQKNDSLEFWRMQNEYNSPAQQMQRFKDAGLNPHLIYGQGNGGNAAPIPTPDAATVNFREPRLDSGRADLMAQLLGAADLRIKNAQADNLQVQNRVLQQDVILRAWQAQRAGFDFQFESGLAETSADFRREQLRGLTIGNDVLLNRDAREAAMTSTNVKEAAERMLNLAEQRKAMPLERGRIRADTARIRKEIELMEQKGILNTIDINLRKQGINPSDPMWARYIGMFLSDVYEGRVTAGSTVSGIWDWLTKPGVYDYPDIKR